MLPTTIRSGLSRSIKSDRHSPSFSALNRSTSSIARSPRSASSTTSRALRPPESCSMPPPEQNPSNDPAFP